MGVLTSEEKNQGSEKPALSLNLPHRGLGSKAFEAFISLRSHSKVEGGRVQPQVWGMTLYKELREHEWQCSEKAGINRRLFLLLFVSFFLRLLFLS